MPCWQMQPWPAISTQVHEVRFFHCNEGLLAKPLCTVDAAVPLTRLQVLNVLRAQEAPDVGQAARQQALRQARGHGPKVAQLGAHLAPVVQRPGPRGVIHHLRQQPA